MICKPNFIIGLTGRAGSGKDTARAILQEHGFVGLAFADPIRDMIAMLFASNGINSSWMHERHLKEQVIPDLGVSYRHMAQTLGTEWGRSLQPDFWLRIAGAYMDSTQAATFDNLLFVISDVRFANEAAWVRARGGVVWRIERPGIAPVRAHASEAEIDQIEPDLTLHNTGSIDDLRKLIAIALVRQAAMVGVDAPELEPSEALCQCASLESLTAQELETGRCQECGKAVVA